MLFIISMRPPASVPSTLQQCSDMSRYNSMKWAPPYIINGVFESHRAYCWERGRREVASVGTKDLRSHLKLFFQHKIGLKTCSSLIILLLTYKYLSTARFLSSRHSVCLSSFFFFLLVSLITSVPTYSSVVRGLCFKMYTKACFPHDFHLQPTLSNCLYSLLQRSSSRYASVLRWAWGCPIFSCTVGEDLVPWSEFSQRHLPQRRWFWGSLQRYQSAALTSVVTV